ncbi:excalibur calcium-binding domain-containing protein [Georgenia phoenicis]|uniref:excalibur calcium-binding domain-containing protein n=1 Tax=unclassified Georgenia TaxID=2626815 RepID=UPI0039AFE9ED
MSDARAFLSHHKLGVGIVTAALLVVGGVAVAGGPETSTTVAAVVDGHTVDVVVDGEKQRVRLLNVLTPDAGECLHDEAVAFLAERIPPGTEVTLEYDEERVDNEGHTLAGVLDEGALVNEEIARAGLGVAVVEEPNRRFYDAVLTAQQAAEVEGLGLFSETTTCTLPAQVRAYGEEVEQLEAGVRSGTLEEIDRWSAEAATVAAAGAALATLLDGDDTTFPLVAFTGERWTLRDDVEAWTTRVAEAEETMADERAAEEERLAREEAERLAREEAERRAAEEAERAAAEEAARAAEEAARAEEGARAERESAAQAEAPSSSGGSAYYKNCTAAREAGAAPVYAGDPGYARHLDRDGDGVGCE